MRKNACDRLWRSAVSSPSRSASSLKISGYDDLESVRRLRAWIGKRRRRPKSPLTERDVFAHSKRRLKSGPEGTRQTGLGAQQSVQDGHRGPKSAALSESASLPRRAPTPLINARCRT